MHVLDPRALTAQEAGYFDSIRRILFAVLLVAAIGLSTAIVFQSFHVQAGFVPQLLTGVAAMALVMHLHLASQRTLMREVSAALTAAACYTERLEQFSFVDPHTELFNRRYLDQLFNQQLRWINRTGRAATLLLFEVSSDGQKMAPEHLVVEAARLLRSNFRGSDYILRNSAHQLLVLLPETDEKQAHYALDRLADKVDHWNLESHGSAMMLQHEVSVCHPGGDLWQTMQFIEEKLAWSKALAAGRAEPYSEIQQDSHLC